MKWLVADSLSCPEQFFCSHLSSYSHYLREAGEDARSYCMTLNAPGVDYREGDTFARPDVVFALDRYDRCASWSWDQYVAAGKPVKRIAQVAAICNPMPWDVRKPDGSPAYDLVISSIPWMVETAREKGCRAEYQQLCFDHRALTCSMGVQKDIDCLFVGTVDGNHVKRAKVLHELGDLVTIAPPTFGRGYYRLLARAKTSIQIHAEWAKGARNALRIYETIGLGGVCLTDGLSNGVPGWELIGDPRARIQEALDEFDERAREGQGDLLTRYTYIQRIPELISWARSL